MALFKKKDVFDVLYGKGAELARSEFSAPVPVSVDAAASDDRDDSASLGGRWQNRWQDGEKYPGGFGPTQLLTADYWTLRARSVQLFEENHYARGVIRRLVTNVINTGLHLEATPEEAILGYEADGLAEWAETTETFFALWANEPSVCDFQERSTFGSLQQQAFIEALIAGDVLVMLQQDPRSKLPRLRLVSGSAVQTPLLSSGTAANGNKIIHGVEVDANGRHVAFYLTQPGGDSKRIAAYGEKSGRRLAWLVYATEKRLDDVRGKPILSLILQSLKEIDRYRDALQRKAVINSILAMYIQKDVAKPGGGGMAANATRRGRETIVDTTGTARTFKTQEHIPGLIIDELQVGEEPKAFTTNGTTEEFGKFEEAVVQSIAWHLEIPPEILGLAFSSNYSASQAASNEFKLYLNKANTAWAEGFCQPVYADWLLSSVLADRIKARGFLDAWRDYYAQAHIYSAWTSADWAGQIKPSVDPVKVMKAADLALELGLTTRARLSREIFGMKYSRVVPQLARENVALANAKKPLAELEASTKPAPIVNDNGGPPVPGEDANAGLSREVAALRKDVQTLSDDVTDAVAELVN